MPNRPYAVALVMTVTMSVTGAQANQEQPSKSSQGGCCAVLELRQYTLKPGQRDALIALFDRHFVESQEAVGMTIVGQFRDRHRPDRFVWIRGFSNMQRRHAALEQFYGGPVWAEHKAAANTTMLDVSDVRLLKPSRPDTAFHIDVSSRPALSETRPTAIVLAGIHRLRQPADASVMLRFEEQGVPALRRAGVHVDSVLVTESAPNTFTRLPVREGDHLLVWFGSLKGSEVPTTQRLEEANAALGPLVDGPLQVLELEPTPRSLLGHHRTAR
jgi:hypothetical protein